ncbi:DedA family protein [Solirubrobacter ginsenosidimutans]|uniref:DedA family protein n=1 Tax=Solirubrobacter ginsenosidimutans TaxID=490573 RepID=A0A9X3MV02_9ACTN|nr:DedA family protein [Solirubrobacter ginsenosidimutans]MDA0163000.1 DedA family protein [Solirubrobacter ginsenosidimutans]
MTFAVAPGDWVRNTVSSGGYPALAGLILAENLFPPIPSELILPLAGYYVGQGEMAFVLAVLAATIGSLAGALLLYAIARFGGRRFVLKLGKVLRVKERDLDRSDEWFDRHGSWVVLFGRLVPGARSLVSIPAGLSEMPVLKFTALTAAGSTAWNAALIGAGWALGEHYEKVGGIVGPIGTAVVGLCALAVLGLVVAALRRRRAA